MYTIDNRTQHSVGYGTVFLYLASMTLIFLGMQYPAFLIPGIALGALFFVVPSAILGVMTWQRINS